MRRRPAVPPLPAERPPIVLRDRCGRCGYYRGDRRHRALCRVAIARRGDDDGPEHNRAADGRA
jgi:ribosomal protein S14